MKYLILICAFISSISLFAADCTVVDNKTGSTIQHFGKSYEPVDFSYGGKEISVVFVELIREEYRYMINATLNYGTDSEVQIASVSNSLPMLMNVTFGQDIANWLVIDCK